jgi:hypothetical protein
MIEATEAKMPMECRPGSTGSPDINVRDGTNCVFPMPAPRIRLDPNAGRGAKVTPGRTPTEEELGLIRIGGTWFPEIEPLYKEYVKKIPDYIETQRGYLQRLIHVTGWTNNLLGGAQALSFGFLWAWLGEIDVLTLGAFHGKLGGAEHAMSRNFMEAMALGCQQLQQATFDILKPMQTPKWRVRKLGVGWGYEHHAVVVFEVNRAFQEGVVFDPWIRQEPDVYLYANWEDAMRMKDIKDPWLEEDY